MNPLKMTTTAIALAAAGLLWGWTARAEYRIGDPVKGRAIYNGTCVACHGKNGKGAIPGVPDFTRKDGGLNTESDTVLLRHILEGFQSPNSDIAMPAKGGNDDLTIRDIRNVLGYLHETFHYRKR